jgi:hypothetical protein
VNDPQVSTATTPDEKFKAGLRAVLGTSKSESDAQLAAATEARKKKSGKAKQRPVG